MRSVLTHRLLTILSGIGLIFMTGLFAVACLCGEDLDCPADLRLTLIIEPSVVPEGGYVAISSASFQYELDCGPDSGWCTESEGVDGTTYIIHGDEGEEFVVDVFDDSGDLVGTREVDLEYAPIVPAPRCECGGPREAKAVVSAID